MDPCKMDVGTFRSTKGDDYVKFCTKLGMSTDEAEKMRGTTWHMRITKVDSKHRVMELTCDELPQFNCVDTFVEKVEKECHYFHPYFASTRTKFTFETTGTCTTKGVGVTDRWGPIEMTEKFTEEGLTNTAMCKKTGAGITEMWVREVKTTGWFRMVKSENLVPFMTATGIPATMVHTTQDVMVHLEREGDMWMLTKTWCGMTNTTRFRMDEETTYTWPSLPSLDRKMICTRVGPFKMRVIRVGSKGEKEEWDWDFTDKGVLCTGHDTKSGLTCKLWYECCTNMSGTFKMMSTCKLQEFCSKMGITTDVMSMTRDTTTKLKIKVLPDGLVHCRLDSKVLPLDLTFKFNEEYEHTTLGRHEKIKSIGTRQDDMLMHVSKGPTHTIKTWVRFTDHFAIQTMTILGTDVTTKIIYERMCDMDKTVKTTTTKTTTC